MLNVVLAAIVPAYFVMILGYLAGRTHDVDDLHVATLTALVMDSAIPAAMFVVIVQTPGAALLEQGYLIGALAVSMLVIYGLQFFLQKMVVKVDNRQASVLSLTSGVPNLASVGLPLIAPVFGTGNTVSGGIALAVGAVTLIPLTLVILEASQQTATEIPVLPLIVRSIGRAVLKPIVFAPIAAVVLCLFNTGLPQLLGSCLDLISIGAGGVALFLTGLVLSSQPFCLNRNVVSATLLKNVAQPLLAVAVVVLLGAPVLIGHEAIVLTAVPAGFFGILMALRYRVASPDVGSTFIASSILSLIVLPAAILSFAGPE